MTTYLTPRFVRFPGTAGDIDLLTSSMVIRRLSYTPAQLYLLAHLHGFPYPLDNGLRRTAWRADEVDDWRRFRDSKLFNEVM